MADSLTIRFWGTRGSMIPYCPGPAFGNHTTCVEIFTDPQRPVIVDLGSGAVPAGAAALDRGVRTFDLYMTHLHSDHLMGCFGFKPFYRSDCTIEISTTRNGVEESLRHLFSAPFHPVPFDRLQAGLNVRTLAKRGEYDDQERNIKISWVQVPHPQGCAAYRFDDGTNAIVFATDIELEKTDATGDIAELLAFPYPAGLAIMDGYYTPYEIASFANWGHSTWTQASDMAAKAGVIQLLITHHHPARTDAELESIAAKGAPAKWARERTCWTLHGNRPVFNATS